MKLLEDNIILQRNVWKVISELELITLQTFTLPSMTKRNTILSMMN